MKRKNGFLFNSIRSKKKIRKIGRKIWAEKVKCLINNSYYKKHKTGKLYCVCTTEKIFLITFDVGI